MLAVSLFHRFFISLVGVADIGANLTNWPLRQHKNTPDMVTEPLSLGKILSLDSRKNALS